MSRLQSVSVGAGCCAVAAAGLSPVMSQTPFASFAPLIFLVVIFLVAARFGNYAGMIGTIVAALIFELFLFEPRFSLMVKDAASRNHLIWMVVLGVVISDLLGAYAIREKDERKGSQFSPAGFSGRLPHSPRNRDKDRNGRELRHD